MDKIYVKFFLLALFLMACGEQDASSQTKAEAPYRLDEPDRVFELPDELEEISGLSTLSSTRLLCNEDETGTLYIYNIAEGRLEETLSWGKEGDYEGVAAIEEVAYVLESNGTVYEVRNFLRDDPSVQEFENDRLEDCDAEGLSLSPDKSRLLIACKNGEEKESRMVHAFDLKQGSLKSETYLQLSFRELEEKLLKTDLDKLSLNLRKVLDPKGESGILYPSGIAIHPLTKELYILSAETKLLAVYTAEGELKHVFELMHERFLQPEAITFTENGDMYIGNEGKGGKPTILKFTYVEK